MLILVFAVSVTLMVWWGLSKYRDGDDARIWTGAFLGCISVLGMIIVGAGLYNIDNVNPAKIAYLEENNFEIEMKLADAIAEYQAYEKDAYADFKPVSGSTAMVAVSMYPELKSYPMVQSLLDTYIANNETIKGLKLRQLERSPLAFWLYFGQ